MPRLTEIRLQRGRLLERITTQRYVLIAEVQPVRRALGRVDSARATLRCIADQARRYPAVIGLLTAALFALNIRRTLRLARRGFFAWRTWRLLRQQFLPLTNWWRFW